MPTSTQNFKSKCDKMRILDAESKCVIATFSLPSLDFCVKSHGKVIPTWNIRDNSEEYNFVSAGYAQKKLWFFCKYNKLLLELIYCSGSESLIAAR